MAENHQEPQMHNHVQNSENHHKLFQRVWSEEDEIVLLKGMISYVSENRAAPSSAFDEFHESIKQDLNIKAPRKQLQGKMRSLKAKFLANRRKEVRKGESISFKNPHHREVYELSKRVWNDEGKILLDRADKAQQIVELEAFVAQLDEEAAQLRRNLELLKKS